MAIAYHCVKNVRIWRFYGPYLPTFGLNTEIYSVNPSIQFKCGKIRTIKTPNTDTFHGVYMVETLSLNSQQLKYNNYCISRN